MNTSTSLQALTVIAIGSAILASATPADAARGGFRSAPVRSAPVRAASFTRAPAPAFRFNPPTLQRHVAPTGGVQSAPSSVHPSNARSLLGDLGKIGSSVAGEVKKVGGDVLAGKIQNIPGDVVKTGSKVASNVIKTGANIFTLPPPKLPTPPKASEPQGHQTSDASGFSPAPAPKPIKLTGHPKTTVPAAVLASQIASQRPVFTPTTTNAPAPTTTAPAGSTAVAHPHPVCPQCFKVGEAARQAAATTNARPVNFPVRPQFAGRPGFGTSAPMMSPGPAYVAPATQPAPVAPVATQPSAPAPVQPSCLRQAVTPDGQVVTFDICTNQAVVGPLAQVQTQPQTQTQ